MRWIEFLVFYGFGLVKFELFVMCLGGLRQAQPERIFIFQRAGSIVFLAASAYGISAGSYCFCIFWFGCLIRFDSTQSNPVRPNPTQSDPTRPDPTRSVPFGLSLSKPWRLTTPVRAEPVEAVVSPLHPFGLSLSKPWRAGWKSMLVLRAEAGSRPACESLSFASPKESDQRKGDPQSATPSLRCGATCVGAVAGCAVELALRFARRSDNHGESVHEARALRRACHPATAPPQAQPAGGWELGSQQPNSQTAKQPNSQTAKQPLGPSRCLAAPGLRGVSLQPRPPPCWLHVLPANAAQSAPRPVWPRRLAPRRNNWRCAWR